MGMGIVLIKDDPWNKLWGMGIVLVKDDPWDKLLEWVLY